MKLGDILQLPVVRKGVLIAFFATLAASWAFIVYVYGFRKLGRSRTTAGTDNQQ